VSDRERGLGDMSVTLTGEAAEFLASVCDGDARRALTALEVAVLSQANAMSGQPIVVDRGVAEESIQRKAIQYDREGDAHYDAISAMIKSIRGGDPDAAVYWLARMLEAGEDPRFVARRIVIAAAEDIGNADPQGLMLAQAAADATNFIGMPECQLPLAQAAIYLACAPKSNASAMAVWKAAEDVREGRLVPVPVHLRDAHYGGSKRLGHGEGYKYPHDFAGGEVAQDYLGVDRIYYEPTDRGAEAAWREYLTRIRALRPSGE
jgi:putative ATPase